MPEVHSCTDCKLAESRSNIINGVIPDGGCDILFVTDAPDVVEDYKGQLLAGRSGRKLKQMLKRVGIDEERVGFTSAVRCRPPDDRAVRPKELEACRKHLTRDIDEADPNIIITLGATAFEALHESERTLTEERGNILKSSRFGRKLLPTYDPSYIGVGGWFTQYTMEHHLMKAASTAHTKKMPRRMGKNYSVITNIEEARAARDYILQHDRIAFDWETEGFDTFDHDEILCLGITVNAGEAFVFPLRGSWERWEEDHYADWQIELGDWQFVEKDGETHRVLVKRKEEGKKSSRTIIKPAFPAGSLKCRYEHLHNRQDPAYLPGHKCRGFLTNVLDGKLVPFPGGGRMHGKLVPTDYIKMVDVLEDILTSDIPKVAQNGKFDVHAALWQLGLPVRSFRWDTMQLFHLVKEDATGHNSEVIREHFTMMPNYDTKLKTIVKRDGSYAAVPNELLWYYTCGDTDATHRALDPLWEELLARNPENGPWLYENIAMPLQRALVQIEHNGMLVDIDRLRELGRGYAEKIREFERRLETLCSEHNLTPVTWTNDNQLRNFLFKHDYEVVVQKGTLHKHRPCKGEGCAECTDGKIPGRPQITKPMRGMGLPDYLAVKSKKTNENGTGKKTFQQIQRWSYEDVKFVQKTIDRRPVRVATKTPLTQRAMESRAWKREIVTLIQQMKTAVKAKDNFLDGNGTDKPGLFAKIKSDGRIHSTYLQLTETARLSSTDPNLQNITNTADDDPKNPNYEFRDLGIRTMFVVPDGYDRISLDYRAQEVRVMAYLAGEQYMQEVCHTCMCGEIFLPTVDDPERPLKLIEHMKSTNHEQMDVHRGIATKVFKVPYDAVTSEQRRRSKNVTFGLGYGQTEYGLSMNSGMPLEQSRETMRYYFNAYKRIEKYQARQRKKTRKGEEIPNAFGRFRDTEIARLMKGFSPKQEYEQKLRAMERERLNYPTQSSSGEIMNLNLIALTGFTDVDEGIITAAHEEAFDLLGYHPSVLLRDLGVKVINVVHDSLDLESPKEHTAKVISVVEQVMVGLPWQMLGWFLPVDVTVGRYWGDKSGLLEKAA